MRRRIGMVLLALGAVGGIGGGVASMMHRGSCHRGAHGGWGAYSAYEGAGCHDGHRQRFVNDVAQACLNASRRGPPPPQPVP